MVIKVAILHILLFVSVCSISQVKIQNKLSGYTDLIDFTFQQYPELDTIHIKIKSRLMLNRSMAARPNTFFLLQKKNSYVIVINHRDKVLGMYTNDGFIGILGHEFAHIAEYISLSDHELIRFGIHYVLKKDFRKMVENRVDSSVFDHDLGEYLIYGVEQQYKNQKYWKKKEGIYYSPKVLKKILRKSHIY